MSEVATHAGPGAGTATIDGDVQRLGARSAVVALLTYNNAATVGGVAQTACRGLSRHFPDATLAMVNADAGWADGTAERLAALGLPAVIGHHEAPLTERSTVPFHGVPGRGPALQLALNTARRLGARVVVLLEADVTSVTESWLERL